MKTIIRALVAPLVLGALAAVAGACSDHSTLDKGSELKGEAAFDPTPSAAEQETIDGQLKRYKGQTRFLTPYSRYYRGIYDEAGGLPQAAAAGSAQREVQEADVFKIGAKDSKLLYLLNNHRGLQVVSYENGPDEPKLLGRVAATGNYPDQMYFDEEHRRLVVLEKTWYDRDGDYYGYSALQSRLVIYDVADPAAPKIAQVTNLNGEVAESRMVGKALYVATSVRPSWEQQQRGENGKGYVYSFNLEAAGVEAVETHELAAPVAYGATMNVVEIKEGEAFKYYLVAVLSKSGWGWWDRQSLVEVVDISDAEGKVKPLMVVSAKGAVRERSQTMVKNGTLIVTSNYLIDGANTLRVSVETFKLPAPRAEIIDNNEAEFRRLYIDRTVEKKRQELTAQGIAGDALTDQLSAYREELVADPELGLAGRFVKTATDGGSTALLKKVPDSVVTIGSTQGLSAAVQDVRYDGNMLYVFWVPANNIDPLDVFDITAPESGVKHLSHLEFDGWIQRAIPVSYQGRNFVLGLGWVIPSVNNETNRRFPQVMLFEITKTAGGRVRADVLAQKQIGSSSTWANFQAEDKEIEVNFTGSAQGAIMYPFASWEGSGYQHGGKLIGFDLAQADVDAEKVFSEGGVLSTQNEGWLRRLFTNREIARVNSFSDEALGTFDVAQGIGAAGAIMRATSILELARNIRAYETAATQGVQIISDWYWAEDGATELRLVSAKAADAEAPQALASVKIPGAYVHHLKVGDDTLYVLTQENVRATSDDGNVTYKTRYIASIVKVGMGLSISSQGRWDYSYDANVAGPRLGYAQKLVRLADGRVLAATGNELKLLSAGAAGELLVAGVALNSCGLEGADVADLKDLGGKLYVTFSQTVKDDRRPGLAYLRNFFAPASVENATLACAAPINIPGSLLHVAGGSHAVTSDVRHLDIVEHGSGENRYWDELTSDALDSLALSGGSATLADLYDPKNVATDSMKVAGDKLVFVESTSVPYYGWQWGQMVDDVAWFPGRRNDRTENKLVMVGFDAGLAFNKTSYVLDLPASTNAQVSGVFASEGDGYLVAVTQGQNIGVLGFDLVHRPVAKKLAVVNPRGEREDAQAFVKTSYWYGTSLHFTPALKSLEIAAGYTGIIQAYVVD